MGLDERIMCTLKRISDVEKNLSAQKNNHKQDLLSIELEWEYELLRWLLHLKFLKKQYI